MSVTMDQGVGEDDGRRNDTGKFQIMDFLCFRHTL